MGRIYFNPDTGEFWEANSWCRKPPPGFIKVGRRPMGCKKYFATSYFCPVCKTRHPIIRFWSLEVPLYVNMLKAFGEKYGCKVAQQIIDAAARLGGLKRHYEVAEKLTLEGALDLIDTIVDLPPSIRQGAIRLLLEGCPPAEVEKKIAIAALLGRKSLLKEG